MREEKEMAQSGNGGLSAQWGLGARQLQLPPKSPRGASSTGHDLQMSNMNENQQGFYGWFGFPQQVGKHHRTFSSMGFVPNSQTAPWLEEVINLPVPKRGMHRRSSSDSLAFVVDSHADASALHHPEIDGFDCGSSSTTSIPSREFDKFDEDQLLSMFADIEPFHKQQQQHPQEPASAMDIGLMESQTPMSTSENPSTPSDNNSICENLVEEKPAVAPPAKQIKTEQEVQSVRETEPQRPQEQQQPVQPAFPNTTSGSSIADLNNDPKRVKRILANRQSAQRSRIRKLQYIAELERSVNALQAEVSTLSPQVAYLDHQRLVLNVDNSALKQRMAALAQDKLFKDAHYEALRKEVQCLRQLYQQQQCLKEEEQVKPAGFGSEHQQMHGNGVGTCLTSETEANRKQMQSENKETTDVGNSSSSSNQQALKPLSCLKAEAASSLAYSSDYMVREP